MVWKSYLPAGLFTIVGAGSCYVSLSPMNSTYLDDYFYQDSRLFNRFEYKDYLFKNGIEFDFLGVRDYFFNNSFKLIFDETTSSTSSTRHRSNAFLLNILYPDWITDYHNEKSSYVPSRYSGGEEFVLLLGTTLSFADKLFQTTTTTKSGNLYFSHPWPIINEGSRDNRFIQDYLYELKDKDRSDVYYDFDYGNNKPYFFKVETQNKVELVYAAKDLQINKDLLDIGFDNLDAKLTAIHTRDNSSVSWVSDHQSHKFAVNFAVIKISLKITDVKKEFLNYLLRYYDKSFRIPSIFKSNLKVSDRKVQKIYMGGWESMDEREIEYHTMDNLYAKPSASSDSSKSPSQVTSDTSSALGIDLYYSPLSSEKASEYSATIVGKYPNDESGSLWVEYEISNNSKTYKLPKTKRTVFTGYKSSSSSPSAQAISTLVDNEILKNRKFQEYFRLKPKAEAEWKEFEVIGSYLNYSNINDLSKNPKFLTYNNQQYLDLSHHLEIPNMNLKGYDGTLAIVDPGNRQDKYMIGMYGGTDKWNNPISGERYVGNIMMFVSPWRYDLFNMNNNLSKPTLASTLASTLKEQSQKYQIIQTGRWLS